MVDQAQADFSTGAAFGFTGEVVTAEGAMLFCSEMVDLVVVEVVVAVDESSSVMIT
jgi:hypothetical protein